MPTLHVPGAHPQPLAGADGAGDVVDVVLQYAVRDEDQVVKGGPAWMRRVPRPVVVVGVEVLEGGHLQAVRGADRGLEAVQRDGGRTPWAETGPRGGEGRGGLPGAVGVVCRPSCVRSFSVRIVGARKGW